MEQALARWRKLFIMFAMLILQLSVTDALNNRRKEMIDPDTSVAYPVPANTRLDIPTSTNVEESSPSHVIIKDHMKATEDTKINEQEPSSLSSSDETESNLETLLGSLLHDETVASPQEYIDDKVKQEIPLAAASFPHVKETKLEARSCSNRRVPVPDEFEAVGAMHVYVEAVRANHL